MNIELVLAAAPYELWIDVKCAIFVALIMAVAAEIVIEKSDICVWQKASSSKKWAVASELRNFVINGFYRHG